MPHKPATSYGEILGRTVVDPSGALPPDRDQVRAAQSASEPAHHPMTPAEHTVAMAVRSAFNAATTIDSSHVMVIVQDHRVFLTGTVPGPSTVARLEDIAGTVHGVQQVISELEVK